MSQIDPLWAILTDPDKRGGKWDLAEFFARGEADVAELMNKVQLVGLPEKRTKCLDFGCGIGRLTRPMRDYFTDCSGIDLSQGMVAQAKRFTPECTFYQNSHPDLSMFDTSSFDFVYSLIVLQHLESQQEILRYVEEFLRVIVPRGLAVFQVPASLPLRCRLAPKRRLYTLLKTLRFSSEWLLQKGLAPIRMTAVSEARISQCITRAGGQLLRIEADEWGGR